MARPFLDYVLWKVVEEGGNRTSVSNLSLSAPMKAKSNSPAESKAAITSSSSAASPVSSSTEEQPLTLDAGSFTSSSLASGSAKLSRSMRKRSATLTSGYSSDREKEGGESQNVLYVPHSPMPSYVSPSPVLLYDDRIRIVDTSELGTHTPEGTPRHSVQPFSALPGFHMKPTQQLKPTGTGLGYTGTGIDISIEGEASKVWSAKELEKTSPSASPPACSLSEEVGSSDKPSKNTASTWIRPNMKRSSSHGSSTAAAMLSQRSRDGATNPSTVSYVSQGCARESICCIEYKAPRHR